LVIAVSASIVLWNLATNGAVNTHVAGSESGPVPVYSAARVTTQLAAGSAAAELDGALTVIEIAAYLQSATASTFGVGRPAAAGTPTISYTIFQQHNPSDHTSVSRLATGWATAPTVPTQFFRRVSLSAGIGENFILNFPFGLKLNAANLVLWNITTNAAAEVHVTAADQIAI
jgi:hypothetical protein